MTDVFGGNGRYIYDDLDVNNHKIINCLDPDNDQDVATKHYVDVEDLKLVGILLEIH